MDTQGDLVGSLAYHQASTNAERRRLFCSFLSAQGDLMLKATGTERLWAKSGNADADRLHTCEARGYVSGTSPSMLVATLSCTDCTLHSASVLCTAQKSMCSLIKVKTPSNHTTQGRPNLPNNKYDSNNNNNHNQLKSHKGQTSHVELCNTRLSL